MPRFLQTKAGLAAAVGAVAFVVALALVLVSVVGGGGSSKPAVAETAGPAPGAAEVATMLDGIPQRGAVLGSPKAPLTMVEFADVQCPYCAEFAVRALPQIVRDYVRAGKLRIEFNGMAFLGPDSDIGLKTAVAAAGHNRLWNVLELLFRNQGGENAGWLTDSLVRSIAVSSKLDVTRLFADRVSAPVASSVEAMSQRATNAGITSTPSFLVGRTGRPLQRFAPTGLDSSAFAPTLDALLAE
jgi:protein-disulfide isomerase